MSPPKISALVVDPDSLMLTIFQRLGRRLGLEITYAPDVSTAKHHLAESSFDAAFLELRVPDFVSGHALLLSVRQRRPQLPVVIVSGDADSEEEAAALRAGVLGRLHKPFATEALEALLAKIRPVADGPSRTRLDGPDERDLAALPTAVRRFAERFASRRATAILAARYDQATNSDIAAQLGVSETTVKRTLQVAFFDPLDARFANLETAAAAWLERRHGTAESPKPSG